ncbi:hypothetical protein SEA_MOLLYMUR_52 [Gordonia phage Mollymur]|uniref:Uncharacterized protein n=1 Tax=Gordonia phage Mollymur TaxID=2590895 RepID=A0A4Y6E9S2_9CAUD|nr:hypothetical protein PQB84_gp073 [Gordonia phage Mollymur]QDF15413.1 hypothetical protein SEA_MOLLYMUR_52 [Gordonia phage Mollymur]
MSDDDNLIDLVASAVQAGRYSGRMFPAENPVDFTRARIILAAIRASGRAIVTLPAAGEPDIDGHYRIPVLTDRPQDNPHLCVDPLDMWGERSIHLLGVPVPVRGPAKARSLANALHLAVEIIEGTTP